MDISKQKVDNEEPHPNIPSENILKKNWRYPRRFPNLTKHIYGIMIEPEVWKCLRKGKLVKSPIIDGWLQLMKNTASNAGLTVLPFKSFHYELLSQCDNTPPIELTHWLWSRDCWSKDAWLFPLVANGHCSLLIVAPKSKIFLFMDGPHKDPPENLLKYMCGLMETVRGDLDWTQWILYQPSDYPVQHPKSNNCVIHVCAWCYVMCTGEFIACVHKEMAKMRRLIAAKLYAAPDMEEDLSWIDSGEYEAAVRTSSTTWEDVIWMMKTPQGYSSTLEYCSSMISRLG